MDKTIPSMKKICFVLTAEFAVKAFMREHLRVLSQQFDVSLVVNTQNRQLLADLNLNVTLIPIAIRREIHPLFDAWCLLKLMWLFASQRYDAVHSVTPKAGLLTMIAGWFTRRPMRVHTFQGEVWITQRGFMRWLLITLDKLVSKLATHLTIVSNSEKHFLLQHNIIDADKAIVFHEGSIAGVDLKRFFPDKDKRQAVRERLGIPLGAVVLLFIGRLNRDKGLLDLVNAYAQMPQLDVHLLIVGPDEHKLLPAISQQLKHKRQLLHIEPETNQPADYMNAADVLCLPSYREGFGVVIIEAAACAKPSLASNIYGITDALVDGHTGLLHAPRQVCEIHEKLQLLVENTAFRQTLGEQALSRVLCSFDSQLITHAWLTFYQQNLHQ
jgi:glycosyltransferase involved in cell wall biosynthesis